MLLSAGADDELTTAEEHAVAAHVAGCRDCAEHADRLASLTRLVRVRPARADGGLVERVMADVGGARLGRGAWLRPALAWCGAVIAVQSVGPLVLGEVDGAPTHVARHVGASGLALAVALLYAAWRAHRALGVLPFVGALFAATVLAMAVDMASGSRAVTAESVHVAELVGMALLWLLAGSPGWERATATWRSLRSGRGAPHATS